MTVAAAREPALPSTTPILTDEQITAFERDGFLAIPRLVDADEVARLRLVLERLFAERAGRERGAHFDLSAVDVDGKAEGLPQILEPSKLAPELAHGRFHEHARAASLQLLGGPADELGRGGDHAILKPARHGAATPWHQDEAYWPVPMQDARSCSTWLALQEATVDNGCMWFVPGSHRLGVLMHQPIGGDPRVHGLETLVADTRAAVPVPLPAGGAVIHHVRTLHYAGPNRTGVQRYAYIVGFWRPGVPRTTPRDMPWLEAQNAASSTRVAP